MTKEEFDSYRFSVCTEINCWDDRWDKISEVDFVDRRVWISQGYVHCSEIKGIRENPELINKEQND